MDIADLMDGVEYSSGPSGAGAGAASAGYTATAESSSLSHQVPVAAPAFRKMERCPERYGRKASRNRERCSHLASDYFRENVKRVRQRNQRYTTLDESLTQVPASDPHADRLWVRSGTQEGRYLRFLRTRDGPNNYQTLRIIGRGGYGEVRLVQRQYPPPPPGGQPQIFALKTLLKREMVNKNQLAYVRAERDILAEADSPWLVKLYTTFQDSKLLYLLLEYVPGGDLMGLLIQYEFFTEDVTRFYIAEMVLAIDAVHKLGFIHRDIKPDNVLIDAEGHIKLTDFGLSTGFHTTHDKSYYAHLMAQDQHLLKKRDRDSVNLDTISLTTSNRAQINGWRRSRRALAYSAVGTPDYVAPELLEGRGYSFECDWWSMGAILYECLIGWAPFCSESQMDTYRKVVNWEKYLSFPRDLELSRAAEDLILRLMCRAEDRLGHGGSAEVQSHPFFAGVAFSQLRQYRAPMIPTLKSALDTSYFPDDIDQTQRMVPGAEVGEDMPDLSLPFIGYTFRRYETTWG
ncbi:Serine/threonine-protein kinase cot-1 [Ceratocystis lukuohia]|uniref:non-specific serine/threonine protein kinase n=3 Tax=Ceratocystis TaxID=5157 RepID=A0A0F8AZ63_CERFI|nr:Serine/threonine-protein kinase cot-1 [Ceratocystis platani]PHH50465.1 Serine/threonine-protein kinase cot-1 [Ceratocystis fimbriata CBS 114723]